MSALAATGSPDPDQEPFDDAKEDEFDGAGGRMSFLDHLDELRRRLVTAVTAIFVGWVWRVDQAIDEPEQHGARFAAAGLWSVLIKWVCPVAIGIIIVYTFITM